MREKPRDNERLKHMIEAIDNILEFVRYKSFEAYQNDKILRFAVIKNLEIVGEAAYLLTKHFKAEHVTIEWNDIIGMRHVLVHGYYQIKDEIIWATIEAELQPLRKEILDLREEGRPSVLKSKEIGDRILNKILGFVDTFVHGVSGS